MIELAALVIFASIALLILGILWKDDNPMEERLAGLQGTAGIPQPSGFVPARQKSFTGRILVPLGDSLGTKIAAMLPTNIAAAIEKQLLQAGRPITLGGFLVAVCIIQGVAVSFGAMMLLSGGGMMTFLVVGAMVVLGFLAPRIWLSNRVRHRQKVILKSLPDAFDLVTTCVEAGLGLDAALAKVAEKVEGPFAEELLLALKEVSLGKLRREALKEMGERAGVPDLMTFINAVIQAETMGTSIAAVLRVQAEQMRTRRRQRAEQQAYQAPVKMIFPLALCIFPTLFIVILGPAGISIYYNFVGGG